jgi:hypothetical protein
MSRRDRTGVKGSVGRRDIFDKDVRRKPLALAADAAVNPNRFCYGD